MTIVPVEGFTAMPDRALKLAAAPTPSAELPGTLLPARVETTPAGVMTRRRLLSVRTQRPDENTAIPFGKTKLADVPAPSAEAVRPLPANVETPPAQLTRRMQLLLVSATRMPSRIEEKATPCGLEKLAAAPRPSTWPAAPLPARVVTTPPG